MKSRKVFALAAVTMLLAVLTACGKDVSIQETGAKIVPGTSNLYRFCDPDTQTLIYFSKWQGQSDEYEWFYPGGCAPVPPTNVPNGDSTDDKDDN